MLTPHRVLARYLQADALGNPKDLLQQFGAGVDEFGKVEPKVKPLLDILDAMDQAYNRGEPWEANQLATSWSTTHYGDVSDVWYAVEYSYKRLVRVANTLFLAILQQYAVPANKVKKVQDAAKFWSKSRMVLRKDKRPWAPRNAEAVVAYNKLLSTYREQVALVTDIVENAKPHAEAEDTKVKAGPFTLVNTGNFPPKTMEAIKEAVEKATKALTSVGLGKVCYGDILVTNRITSKATIAAFYMIASDEMFVRADVKATYSVVHTICHELAHRLQFKFLKSKTSEIRAMYQDIARGVRFDPDQMANWPEIGREVQYKGDDLVVLTVDRSKNKIQFGEPPAQGVYQRKVYTAPLQWWQKNIEGETEKSPDSKGFVSAYAQKGGPDENFAEMVAYYALGKLPKPLVEMLEPILGSS